jgi:hypothetical protein
MGSVDRTTDASPTNPITLATNNDIRGRMVAGQKITLADIGAIRDAINAWNGHTHDYFDQVTLHDFGNVGSGGSSQTLTSGGGPDTTCATPSGTITASVINESQNKATAIKNHYHTHSAA